MWSNKKTASFLWAKIWWVLTFCALSRLSFGAQPSVKINLAPPLMPHHATDAAAAATRLCYTQSPSFLRSHRDFLINYNHQQLSRVFFSLGTPVQYSASVQQLLEAFFFLLFFLRLDLSPFFHAVLASMMHIAQIMSENNRYIVQIWTINDNIEIVFMCEENVVVLPKITKNISQWIQQVTGCNQMFGSEKSLKPYSILKTQIIGHNNILSFLRLNDWICKLSRWIYWIHNTFFQVARSSSRTFGIPWV